MVQPKEILELFGLNAEEFQIHPIKTGYINNTYRVSGKSEYILQRINTNVFKNPEAIDSNIRLAGVHLKRNFPAYVFPSLLTSNSGKSMVRAGDNSCWRIFPYIRNTYSINEISNEGQAFKAAAGFGELLKNLDGIDTALFKETIPDFHNLMWRWEQYLAAKASAPAELIAEAATAIQLADSFQWLVTQYNDSIQQGILTRRIVHNDTKINNILFDQQTGEVVCVIDLDTLMPGFFIYDFGDLVRTCVSPVSEEEQDLTKVLFRPEVYNALLNGYVSQVEQVLAPEELVLMPFAGKMMTYIMALRMLTDFLNGNIYYQVTYREMNLHRALNQLTLLQHLQIHLA